MYDNRSIILGELIGLDASVSACKDSRQKGIKGVVVYETKNTLLIQTKTGLKRIVKKSAVFRFWSGGRSYLVNGEEINFRPVERTEKALKFYKRRKE